MRRALYLLLLLPCLAFGQMAGGVMSSTPTPVTHGGTGAASARGAAANLGTWHTIARGTTTVTAPADANENILATCTIPAGAIGPNGSLRYQATFQMGASNTTARARLGGIGGTIYTSVLTNNLTVAIWGEIHNRNSQSSQVSTTHATTAFGEATSAAVALTTSAVNTAAATTLVFTQQKTVGGDTATVERFICEVNYGA